MSANADNFWLCLNQFALCRICIGQAVCKDRELSFIDALQLRKIYIFLFVAFVAYLVQESKQSIGATSAKRFENIIFIRA